MKNKLILLYVFFANSSFCKSMASFSEFSELFLSQEINELDGIEFDKDVFEKSISALIEEGIIIQSSKQHLTTVSSWRITKKGEDLFHEKQIINKWLNLEDFFKFF